jgi:hypothetical protein
MRTLGFGLGLLLTAACACFSAAQAGDKDKGKGKDDGWVAIFNGKDIDDWKISYGGKATKETSTWKVEGGVIVSDGEVSHLFSPRGDYENFEVRAEIAINDLGNSGFYFRTAFGPGFPKGYEAQVNSTQGDPVKTGSIYNHVKIFKKLHKPDEWFKYHLKVQGNRIWVTVNDELLYEYVDQASSHKTGHFAFQQHHKGSQVKIRKLEVKELPSSTKKTDKK